MVKPRILHLAAGCWATGGGVSEVVGALAYHQARLGYAVTLVFLDCAPEHPLVAQCRAAGVTVKTYHRFARNPLYFSWGLAIALPKLLRGVDHVHLHGCWTFPIWWGSLWARLTHRRVLISAHGFLDPVRRTVGRLRKAVAWRLMDRRVFATAACLHATSEVEAAWYRTALGAKCPPIRVVPLGVDAPLLDSVPPQPRQQRFLFLGRLHPLKGLDLLLEAWRLADLGPAWELMIAGMDEGVTVPEGWGVRRSPPLLGEAKVRALRSAACLVQPSRSENFGLTVAEALWCRTPVIATTGTPWTELGDFRVELTPEALADGLRRMAALTPEAREARFAPLFDSAQTRFAWPTLAARFAELLCEIPPKFHRYGLGRRLWAHIPTAWALLCEGLAPTKAPLRVLNDVETLERVLSTRCSVARLGEGEFRFMRGSWIGFQRPSRSLRRRLHEIARHPLPNCLTCLPDVFDGVERFAPEARVFWRRFLRLQRPWVVRHFGRPEPYGDALISRVYIDTLDRVHAAHLISLWRQLWAGRDLLIIEGHGTNFGDGTDLFETAASIKRLRCPAVDAWDAYEGILSAATTLAEGRLVVIALGPTATVLAYDLAKLGHQAIDCGHLDVEVLWMKMGATTKVPIPSRRLNEVPSSGLDLDSAEVEGALRRG